MTADRSFDWIVLAGFAGLFALGVGRGVALSRRGHNLFPLDRQRTAREALVDGSFLLGFLLFVFESLAAAIPLGFHLLPEAALRVVLTGVAVELVGAVLLGAGLVVYGLALAAFGTSWRFTIDRERAGALVTRGIFARSRNPIYLALTLVALGAALALGRLALVALALAAPLYFRSLIGREERFLRAHYGDAYAAYADRVGRWWTFFRGQAP